MIMDLRPSDDSMNGEKMQPYGKIFSIHAKFPVCGKRGQAWPSFFFPPAFSSSTTARMMMAVTRKMPAMPLSI